MQIHAPMTRLLVDHMDRRQADRRAGHQPIHDAERADQQAVYAHQRGDPPANDADMPLHAELRTAGENLAAETDTDMQISTATASSK